ncbi:MAG: ribonuclease H-like domain-containing protein, partial [Spirochaetota bacterium]|nr:ribonuclease H-like domain-containing protein [Spirochaetota bacterium]
VKADIPFLFPEMENSSIENLLFYDLETTGLSGGAGTVAFLAGFGWVENEKLVINQYFLHDFPGEIDLLLLILELLTSDKILVSYNGKSFDHPLLRTRFLMKGLKLPSVSEIDLLHTSRRLWKNRLPSCRLGNIEAGILDIHRVNDVPGIEVPDIYFNFLKTNQPDHLEGVFKHHLQDIKSLAFLFAYMEDLWSRPAGIPKNDKTSFGKLMLFRNRDEGVELLADSWLSGDLEAGEILSIYYKRKGNFSDAADIWKKMWVIKKDIFQGIELAKYYEHKLKDIESALDIVKLLMKKEKTGRISEALDHRCGRLERKRISG